MGNLWKCPECGAILQKGSPWLGDTFRRSGIIVGTSNLRDGSAQFSQSDVYRGI